MKLKLCLLYRTPTAFWIGPQPVVLTEKYLLGTSVTWGWDTDDPFSLFPAFRRTDYSCQGTVWSISWLGLCGSLMRVDRTGQEEITEKVFGQYDLISLNGRNKQ